MENVVLLHRQAEETFSRIAIVPGAVFIKKKIADIREEKKKSAPRKKQEITDIVISNLNSHATFAIDTSMGGVNAGAGIICLNSGHVYNVTDKSPLLSAFIGENFGIDQAFPEYKAIVSGMMSQCLKNTMTKVHFHSHFRRKDNTLFFPISRNRMLKINESGVSEIANGTEAVYFKIADNFSPFEYREDFLIHNNSVIHDVLFSNLNCPKNSKIYLNKEEASFILTNLLYFIPLAQSMSTRPILEILGSSGSGKSTLLKRIGITLFGSDFTLNLISRNRKELEAELVNNSFCCFDNVDRDLKKGLRDTLAAIATGCGIRQKKYFTNAEQVSFSPSPVIAMTTRNPGFTEKDDDILNRLIIIKLDSLEKFNPENKLIKVVEDARDEILNEMVKTYPAILKDLGEEGTIIPQTAFRMADFQDFVYKAAFHIFAETYSKEAIENLLTTIFSKLEATQNDQLLNNPLFHVLDLYIDKEGYLEPKLTTSDLFKKLNKYDKEDNFGFSKICKSVGSLGKLLANNEKVLKYRYGYERHPGGTGNKSFHIFNLPKDGVIDI